MKPETYKATMRDLTAEFDSVNGHSDVDDSSSHKPIIFWLTHAGGTSNTLAFRMRSCKLSRPMHVLTPRLPQREDHLDVDFDSDINEHSKIVAARILERASCDSGTTPFAIVGHSYGGALAYRVTRILEQHTVMPHRLIICSTRSPDRLTYHKKLHLLSDRELVDEVDKLFGGIPENLREDSESSFPFCTGASSRSYDVRKLRSQSE